MTRRYSLIIEGDANGYSGSVPELPTIVVTGKSMDELITSAQEAVRIYWEAVLTDRSPGATIREIEVDLAMPA